ncbi:hypothetical protein ACWD0G_07205 [Streptomyces goshikiensis]
MSTLDGHADERPVSPADAAHPSAARSGAPQLALPYTCGSRTAVASGMYRSISDTVPGGVGTTRASIVCKLAEHTPDSPHSGVVLEFVDRAGAVWAYWYDGSALEFTARDDCPTADACVLFVRHPGPCSPRINPRYKPDPFRLSRARTALDILHDPTGDWAMLQAASSTAALGIWDELTSSGRWTSMAECDQAALHRCLASTGSHLPPEPDGVAELAGGLSRLAELCDSVPGTVLAGGTEAAALDARLWALPEDWQVTVLGGQHQRIAPSPSFYTPEPEVPEPRPAFDAALARAEQQTARGKHPPRADADWPSWRQQWAALEDRKRGAETRRRLGRLPSGWRVDAVRRIQAGADALGAASVAADLNVLRIYGRYMGSWAGGEPRRPRLSPW